mmetsp:Transcript_23245/g.26358  ORF Transcript_23245/g.26358 Transcript_23245/m.26358 type:complete len:117 (-) Transcript_23245:86-436(-)
MKGNLVSLRAAVSRANFLYPHQKICPPHKIAPQRIGRGAYHPWKITESPQMRRIVLGFKRYIARDNGTYFWFMILIAMGLGHVLYKGVHGIYSHHNYHRSLEYAIQMEKDFLKSQE